MPLALFGALIGAVFGYTRARKAGGNRLDKLQFTATFAIAGGLLGMIAAIILVRNI